MLIEQDQNSATKSFYEIQGNAYSWGKIARLRIEPAFMEVLETQRGDVWAVDLCSSYPLLRQIMTGQHMQRLKTEANKLTGTFIDDLHAPARKNKLPFAINLPSNIQVSLRKELGPKHSVGRQLLTTAVFKLLNDTLAPNEKNEKNISKILFDDLRNSKLRVRTTIEPDGKPGNKGNWLFIDFELKEETLFDILEPILGENTEEFLKETANYFASHLELEKKLRKVNFISLDITPFETIIKDAQKTFPPKMRETKFFKSAEENDRHILANVLRLPFLKESVSFFSSIEGWPYYGKPLKSKGNIAVAKQIAAQLAPGGKAVFFPWAIESEGDFLTRGSWFKKIEKEWLKRGLAIEKVGITRDELLREMSDRELVLSEHSPLLRYKGIFTSLILSKPCS